MVLRRRLPLLPPLVAAVLVLSACAQGGEGGIAGPVLTSADGGGEGGMDAQVVGVLEVRDGCVRLVQEDAAGEHRYPVVWPAGTTWQEDPAAVVLPDGSAVRPGAAVEGAGGYLQEEDVERLAGPRVARAAGACAGPTGEIAVFNAGGEVSVT